MAAWRGSGTRSASMATASLFMAVGVLAATSDPAFALGFIFNQALTTPPTVHPAESGVAVASYQIDTTNTFAIGQTIYLKIEGVADPGTTNAAVGFSTIPSLAVTGPTTGAFGAGPAGDTVHDVAPMYTSALASSAGAASILGVNDELVITLTNSSVGTATDHYTFTVSGIALNLGSAVQPGSLYLHAYTGDGTGSLASAVAIATVSLTAVNRLSGADRFGTAIAASVAEFPTAGTAGAVVLARSNDYPDALVGAPLAAARTAPLLFADGGALTAPTQAEIVRVLPAGRTVYLLGGTSAIPASVAATLSSLGYVVVRYAGADRYGTALAVADALGDPTTVMLATGTNFPDALAAGPAAASVGGVVLLTDGTTLPAPISAYLVAHPGKVYAIGGPAVIADPPATALVGSDRYATAAAVATKFFTSPTTVGMASGVTFADALAGGALLAHKDGPLLLSDPDVLPIPTSAYLTTNKATVTSSFIFGGTNAISSAVQAETDVALGLS
jgi:putative cell wall-binding protein